jgi:membrane-associated protease RseP (regulator of RpoE activity)
MTERGPGKSVLSWREWALSALLFIITFLCVSYAGLFYITGDFRFLHSVWRSFSSPNLILDGFHFSIPFIAILLAHELGHYFACRYYGIRCTPPYFIPAPISIAGTLGAFIKIKSPFINKRALFDVGFAGPLAGFIITLPVLWIGIRSSEVIPKSLFGSGASFGEPYIFRLIGLFALNYDPARQDMLPHPLAMAGWFGLLITSLNLLPIWQLDGGHIAYAVFGPKFQKKISLFVLSLLMLVGLSGWPTPSYFIFGLLVFVFGYRCRFYHPATLSDWKPLGYARSALALLAFVILVLCFTPLPVSISY